MSDAISLAYPTPSIEQLRKEADRATSLFWDHSGSLSRSGLRV